MFKIGHLGREGHSYVHGPCLLPSDLVSGPFSLESSGFSSFELLKQEEAREWAQLYAAINKSSESLPRLSKDEELHCPSLIAVLCEELRVKGVSLKLDKDAFQTRPDNRTCLYEENNLPMHPNFPCLALIR